MMYNLQCTIKENSGIKESFFWSKPGAKGNSEVQMSYLVALFMVGFKQFFNKRNLIVFLIMFLLLLYAVDRGVDQYKEVVANSKEFQKYETLMFKNVMNYSYYSFSGTNYLCVPSVSSIFFTDSSMMFELSAKIDALASLKIYNSCKGKELFKVNNKGFLRFSGVIILLGTLFVLFIGYEAIMRKEYIKFLSGSFSRLKIFCSIIFSRAILIILSLVAIFAAGVGLVRLRGIEFTTADTRGLGMYLGVTLVTLLIFLVIGGMIGTLRSNIISMALILGIWIVSVFILPGVIDSIIDERSNSILSSYKSDLNKLQKITDFENRMEAKYGKFSRNNIAMERKAIEDYWENDRPKIEQDEEKLRGEIAQVIDKQKQLSILFPTTFYNLTALEVSSRGYENYLSFYDYAQKNQRQFARFWIDRVYYNDVKQLVSFIKGDEIVFHGESRPPTNYIPGLVLHLFYFGVLLWVSYIRFKRWLHTPIDKKAFNEKDRDIQLKKDRINVLYSYRRGLRDQLYMVFSGKPGKSKFLSPTFRVTIDGDPVPGTEPAKGFVYICHPSAIPGDIRPMDLISFIVRANRVPAPGKAALLKGLSSSFHNGKTFGRLEPHQQAEVLLAGLPYIKGCIYLVDQLGKNMPLSILVKLKDQLQTLIKSGALVIYLTPDKRVDALPSQPEREVLDLPDWFEAVEAHRFLLDEETGKWRTMPQQETESNFQGWD